MLKEKQMLEKRKKELEDKERQERETREEQTRMDEERKHQGKLMLSANIKNKLKMRHTRVRESIRGPQNLMNNLGQHFLDKFSGTKQDESATNLGVTV